MATTKTTKIVEAISLLSDVLSTEVAEASHFLEDEEETVSTDDYNQVMDSAVEFATAQLQVLETLKHEIEDEVGSDDWTVDGWDVDDDDDEDDVGNGTVVVEGDSEESTEEETPEPTDEEKITALTTANEELADQIAELETEKDVLTQTLKSALDSVDELIDASEAQQTYMETC